MATTTIMSVHVNKGKRPKQCVSAQLNYIMNPEKTDGGALISSHACMPETAVNARSAALLEQAKASLLRAKTAFEAADHELAALELAAANRQIGGITGKNVEPDLLDRIFHRFCIGK